MVFGEVLRTAIAETLSAGDQTILFLNRRGHSTVVQCEECREVASCRNCDIVLTYHASENVLRCHYCGARSPRTDICADCGAAVLLYKGVGTQKVETEIARLFPTARALRLDTDVARRRGTVERTLEAFRLGEVDILLGTQMVAKGLDFPRVTLVGVVNADTQLCLPDFRSAERTFQLLTQVAGRSGRGARPGKVVFQTANAEHYALRTAADQDYAAFYREEMRYRGELNYPPYHRLVNLLFDGKDEGAVMEEADRVARLLRGMKPGEGEVDFLGPAPQPVSRLKGKHRWHLTLRGPDHRLLRSMASAALESHESTSGAVRLTVDVDPASLL
jgi:primosomal protein N' (replication factor Y)